MDSMLVQPHWEDDKDGMARFTWPFEIDVIGGPCVSVGTPTNWASVPGIVERLFPGTKAKLKKAGPGIHDYLYETGGEGGRFTRRECDAILLAVMILDGVDPDDAYLAYRAVRVGGQSHWKQKEEESTMPQILAILAAAGAFIDNPLVKRLLTNLSASVHTPVIWGSEVDSWVIKILYGSTSLPPETRKKEVDQALASVQETYTAAKTEAETSGNYDDLHRIKAVRPIQIVEGSVLFDELAVEGEVPPSPLASSVTTAGTTSGAESGPCIPPESAASGEPRGVI